MSRLSHNGLSFSSQYAVFNLRFDGFEIKYMSGCKCCKMTHDVLEQVDSLVRCDIIIGKIRTLRPAYHHRL